MTLLATSCNSTCAKQRKKDNWGEHFSRTVEPFFSCFVCSSDLFFFVISCVSALCKAFCTSAGVSPSDCDSSSLSLFFVGDWACMPLTWPLQPSRLLCLVDPSYLLLPFLFPWSSESSVLFFWLLVGLDLLCVFLCCCTFATTRACWFDHMSRWFLPGHCFRCRSLCWGFGFLASAWAVFSWEAPSSSSSSSSSSLGSLGSSGSNWVDWLIVSVHSSSLTSSWLWLGLRSFFRTSCHEGIHDFIQFTCMAWHGMSWWFFLHLACNTVYTCIHVCVWNTLHDL